MSGALEQKSRNAVFEELKGFDINISECSGFSLDNMIGCGSFAYVFMGSKKTTGQKVAIKIERRDAKFPQLIHEARVYKRLAGKDSKMLPNMYWHGSMGNFNLMVMQLLGPSLEDIFVSHGREFSLRSIAKLGLRILSCIEFVHSKGFIHRDVKPENLLFNMGDLDKVHLIDFGLAKKYRSSKTKEHYAAKESTEGRAFIGDHTFASLNTYRGQTQSRRDDLESLVFTLLYLSAGSLPWVGQKPAITQELKAFDRVTPFCPQYLCPFFRHVRELSFEEEPNYSLLRSLLRRLRSDAFEAAQLSSNGQLCEYNFVTDWTFHPVSKKVQSEQQVPE